MSGDASPPSAVDRNLDLLAGTERALDHWCKQFKQDVMARQEYTGVAMKYSVTITPDGVVTLTARNWFEKERKS